MLYSVLIQYTFVLKICLILLKGVVFSFMESVTWEDFRNLEEGGDKPRPTVDRFPAWSAAPSCVFRRGRLDTSRI